MDETTDFSALRALKICESIRNPHIFWRKWLLTHVFAVPIDTKSNASIRFVSICPLSHYIGSWWQIQVKKQQKKRLKNKRIINTAKIKKI